jgi:arsenical pump membrane protein
MFSLILALLGAVAIALRPADPASAAVVALLAAIDVMLGAPLMPALSAVLPLLVFLAAALTLAALAERSGLAERGADRLAAIGRGRSAVLFLLVCGATAIATSVVSLDGAVVLMLPLVLALSRRHGAPFAPLFLGTVAVANAASIAVPQGNPTNLVVIEQLGLSPGAFLEQMLLPGLAAAITCAAAAALVERRALSGHYPVTQLSSRGRLTGDERHAAVALGAAALLAFAAPLAGVPVCWPFAGVAAVALAVRPGPRTPPTIPVRLGVQVTGLLVLVGALNLTTPRPGQGALAGLLAVALLVGCAAALANNLPVSVSAASLLAAGPSAYAASIGLAVGSLATPQGSVATMLAAELAGPDAPRLEVRRLLPMGVAGLLAATLVLALQQA